VTLPDKLIDKLVCPECQKSLRYKSDKNWLICDHCQLVYRIQDDIPVLVINEAEKLQ